MPNITGIVQKVENGKVYTVEGNSEASVCQNSYPVDTRLRCACLLIRR